MTAHGYTLREFNSGYSEELLSRHLPAATEAI